MRRDEGSRRKRKGEGREMVVSGENKRGKISEVPRWRRKRKVRKAYYLRKVCLEMLQYTQVTVRSLRFTTCPSLPLPPLFSLMLTTLPHSHHSSPCCSPHCLTPTPTPLLVAVHHTPSLPLPSLFLLLFTSLPTPPRNIF